MKPHRGSPDISNLDILRASAVLFVVFDHSMEFLVGRKVLFEPIGLTGVYLFFVHTSFVLMLSLERQQAKCDHFLASSFYLRRFFRIYPLSVTAILVATIFSIPDSSIAGKGLIIFQPAKVWNLLSNLALVMNLSGHTPILGQLWSLPLEVQMYLLLPPLFLLSRRIGTGGIVLVWCIVAIAAFVQARVVYPGSWRLSLIYYIPDFVPGIIAYTLRGIRPRLPSWLWLPAILCICGLYYIVRISGAGIHEWPLCLAIGFAIPLFRQVRQKIAVTTAHYIAKYSYGIYLTHLFSLWLGFHVYQGPLIAQIFLWLTSLVIFPMAAYHLVEAPCIRVGARLANRLTKSGAAPASATAT